jgi:elongator complex protein 3
MDIEDLFADNSNDIFSSKYSKDYTIYDIVQIFNTNFGKVTIQEDLLELVKEMIIYSTNYEFNSYADLRHFYKDLRDKDKKFGKIPSIKKVIIFEHYKFLYKKGVINRNIDLERFMKIKGSRSRSGVLSVTIFTSGELLGANSEKSSHNIIKTGGCPMDCHYCPFEKDENGIATQPRSYLSTEPGNMRATENKHHPVGQVYQRLFQLEKTGHLSDDSNSISKIELIISGGTFPFYPKEYLIWFTNCAYYACNTYYQWKKMRKLKSLKDEQKINETTSIRVIGLTIETRPDYVTPKTKDGSIDYSQLILFRKLGVTRVQIGIQSTKDAILRKVNRKCTNRENKIGLRRLKQNGFKSDIHIMLDLPGSSPKIDKEVIDEIVNDPNYQADQWKIYPTETTPFTKIKTWYYKGIYKPYAEDNSKGVAYKLIDVIIYAMSKVPNYVRVNRVVRDFPLKSIDGGLKYTNARQLVKNKMDDMGIRCKDIREREIKFRRINLTDIRLNTDKYISSSGIEYFISYTSNNKRLLYGFIRLRINKKMDDVLECIREHALVRELHVYGVHTCVGTNNKNNAQHLGLGTKLLKIAEDTCIKNKCYKIAVISGVGVRKYYRKRGYKLGKLDYMYKNLETRAYINFFENMFLFIIFFLAFLCCLEDDSIILKNIYKLSY